MGVHFHYPPKAVSRLIDTAFWIFRKNFEKLLTDYSNLCYHVYVGSAGVAELADAPDLGSGALRRGGSSPFSRTNILCTL